jgi:Arc/MetJ-type ribon-helix-helix transcriptional regulator
MAVDLRGTIVDGLRKSAQDHVREALSIDPVDDTWATELEDALRLRSEAGRLEGGGEIGSH